MGGEGLFNNRPLCTAFIGVALGILLARALPERNAALIAAAMLLLVLGEAQLLGRRGALLLVAAALIGLLRAGLPVREAIPAGTVRLTGTVAEQPEETDGTYGLLLRGVSLGGEPVRGRVRLVVEAETPVVYGQRVDVTAALREPTYNAAYYEYLGVVALAEGEPATLTLSAPERDAYGLLVDLRAALSARIEELFPEEPGLAAGMLLGYKGGMEKSTTDAMYDAGVGHLLAVSGMNVAILAAALLPLLRFDRPVLKLLILGAFLVLYTLLTCAAPSIVRASVMLFTLHAAFPLRRRADTLSALAFSGLILLLFQPAALLYAGFQLSFLAVYGLALLYPVLRDRLRFLGGAFADVLAGSAAALLATLPSSALFFSSVSVVALLGNVLVLPVAALFPVPALIVVLLSYVSLPLAKAVAPAPGFLLSVVVSAARATNGLSAAVPRPSVAAFLLYLLAILFVSRLTKRDAKTRALYALAALTLSLLVWRI